MLSKKSHTREQSPLQTAAGLGLLGLSGVAANSGVGDLLNRNVVVSYGGAPEMGAGHKEPATQIKKLLTEIAEQNKGNFLGNLNVIDAPVMSYAGDVAPDTLTQLRRKKFLTGMDTGWGLFDPERAHNRYGSASSGPSMLERLTGGNVAQKDPFFLNKFRNVLLFQPDGRSDTTGYMATGDANRVAGLRNHALISYGDFDPAVADYKSGGKMKFTGRAHPLVETSGLNAVMARGDYENFLMQHTRSNGMDIDPTSLSGKKIIAVSGASRGDTVGARARWVLDALKSKDTTRMTTQS